MSSVNASHTIAAITPYVASKGGISALTKAMALSLADHSIRYIMSIKRNNIKMYKGEKVASKATTKCTENLAL